MSKSNKRRPGELIVGVSAAGEVILGVPRPGDIVFTPEQARNIGRLLLQKADEAEQVGRTLRN